MAEDALRIARVRNGENARTVWAYLPDNYAIIAGIDGVYLIAGHDKAGWTLDGYVMPRLASGNIFGEEVTVNMLTREEVTAVVDVVVREVLDKLREDGVLA